MVTLRKIKLVKELFKKAIKTGDFKQDFTLKFGNNGVILRPKKIDLKMLCVKTPLTGVLKEIKAPELEVGSIETVTESLTKEEKKLLEAVFSEKGVLKCSLSEDIKIYEKIKENCKLIKYVPKFYDYEIDKGDSFIIMDFLEGRYIEIINFSDNNNYNVMTLKKIFNLFKENGFDIGDRLEAIYSQEKDEYKIIDLGGWVSIS